MPKRKRFTPEQIITKLREGEVLLSQGKSVEEAARILEIASQTYYRWRKEYGDMIQTQARKLKNLEKENPQSMYGIDKYPFASNSATRLCDIRRS
jgi:transposase-like protein